MPKNTLRFISIYFRSMYYTMEAEFQNIIALLKEKKGTKPVKTVIQKVNPVNSKVDNDDEDTQNLDQIPKTNPNPNPGSKLKPIQKNEVFPENDDDDDEDEDEDDSDKTNTNPTTGDTNTGNISRYPNTNPTTGDPNTNPDDKRSITTGNISATPPGNLNQFKEKILSKIKEIQNAENQKKILDEQTKQTEKITEIIKLMVSNNDVVKGEIEKLTKTVEKNSSMTEENKNLIQTTVEDLIKKEKERHRETIEKNSSLSNDFEEIKQKMEKIETEINTQNEKMIQLLKDANSENINNLNEKFQALEAKNKELKETVEKIANEHTKILNELLVNQTQILDEQKTQAVNISTITSQMTNIQEKFNELDKKLTQIDSSNKDLLQKTVQELKTEEEKRHEETVEKISSLSEELKTQIISLEDKINTQNRNMIELLEKKIDNPVIENNEPNQELIEQIKQTLEDAKQKLSNFMNLLSS